MLRRFVLISVFGVALAGCNRSTEPAPMVAPEPPKPAASQPEGPRLPVDQSLAESSGASSEAAKTSIWSSNWKQAKATAAQSKKDLLLNFTGSDWCRYCQILHREVFDMPVFKESIGKTFVPVVLDFPMDDSALPPAVASQNAQLQAEFRVKGYPTIFLADATGKPYAQTGYREGGAEAYLKHLTELQSGREKRDAAFAKSAGLQGLEKAAALKEGLEAMSDSVVSSFYADVLREISGLDTKDTLGVEVRFGFSAAFEEFQGSLAKKREQGSAAMVQAAEQFIGKRKQASAEQKQQVFLSVLSQLTPPKDDEAALGVLQRIRDLDPESDNGKMAAQNLERLKERVGKAKESGAGLPKGEPANPESGSREGKK